MENTNKYDVSAAKSDDTPSGTVKPISEEKGPDGENEKMLEKDEPKLNLNSAASPGEVKYAEKNGDAKLDIGEIKTAFVGMGKEELMKYANDPFWIRLRWFLFILFWLLWAGMLIGAILIIYAAPKCQPTEEKSWWQQGPLTKLQDYTQTTDLSSIKAKGIQGVIITYPFDPYTSLLKDSSEIHYFLERAKTADINVIVELKPAASNTWFELSEKKNDNYSDFYIWAKGKDEKTPPNNWLRPDNESSWLYSSSRREFYYARDGQPNLNFRNPSVVAQFTTTLTNFLDAGFVGVSLTGVPYLLVDENLSDEVPSGNTAVDLADYNFYRHTKTENQPELGAVLVQWRRTVKERTGGKGVFMLTEDLTTLEPYKVNGSLTVDLPRQSQVLVRKDVAPAEIVKGLNVTFRVMGGLWPLWEHKTNALPEDVLDIVTFLLPGVNLIDKDANVSKELLNIRNTPSIMNGNFSYYTIYNDTVLAYIRAAAGHPSILVALNPTDDLIDLNLPKEIPAVSDEVTVKYVSSNYNATNVELKIKKSSNSIPISAKSAIVLSFVPKA